MYTTSTYNNIVTIKVIHINFIVQGSMHTCREGGGAGKEIWSLVKCKHAVTQVWKKLDCSHIEFILVRDIYLDDRHTLSLVAQFPYFFVTGQFLIGSIVPGDAVGLGKLGGRVQRPGSHRHYLVLRLWQAFQSNNEVVRDQPSRTDAPLQSHDVQQKRLLNQLISACRRGSSAPHG